MNSSLYKATVMHHRLLPKKHRFNYNVFMFYVDVDEIDLLHKKLVFFSREKFNFFSFRKKDHIQFDDKKATVRQNIINFLQQNGIVINSHKIMLLTNMSVFGYNFNPVSFYFIFDENNKPFCSIAEVSNTYREMKLYILNIQQLTENTFSLYTKKYFYVSPFFDLDTDFRFVLKIPNDKLHIKIDTEKDNVKQFISTLTGFSKPLTNTNLLKYSFIFPFITLRIMFLIHLHAFKLFLKNISFHPKAANPQLQQNVYKKYKNNSTIN